MKLTCARREAGARRPALPTSADSPRGPDPRPGRARARFSFLPALALLLGALGLLYSTPAQAQVPAAPTGMIVTPGNAELSLSWTAPSGTLTGYDVHYTSAPATAWVQAVSTTTTSTNLALINGIAYRVRVRAGNNNGNSAWVFGTGTPTLVLGWVSATASGGEGGFPAGQRLQVTTGIPISGTLTYAVGATNPASLSDDLTTGYATTFSVSASAASPATYLNLSYPTPVDDAVNEEHETFTIAIDAGTGYTVGMPATVTVTIIDNDPPSAPSGFSLAASGQQVTASWTKPAGPVTGYQLRYKQTSATGWTTRTMTNTSTQITLASGAVYQVQVRATDGQTEAGNGYGDWSAPQTWAQNMSNWLSRIAPVNLLNPKN